MQHYILSCLWNRLLYAISCKELRVALELERYGVQGRMRQLFRTQNEVDNLGRQRLMIGRTRRVDKDNGDYGVSLLL